MLNKRFHPDEITNWQKCADKKTKGNLTRWMEDVLNKEAAKLLRAEVDGKSGGK